MAYPYDLHLAPNVGRGLPGLPVRGAPDTPAPTTSLFPQYASSANRRLLAPCPTRQVIGNSAYSFGANLFSVHPLAGTRDTGLMARYVYSGGWRYEYVGFRYTREALTFGSPVLASNGNDSLPTQAIALPDGSWVYNRPGFNQVHRVTLNAETLAVSEALLFNPPSSGVLVTGEPYTLATSTLIPHLPGVLGDLNLLLSPQLTLVLFQGFMVEGLYWIGCFEYDLSGQLLAARKLFIPPLHHATTAPSGRHLVVRHVGRWYHCAFTDTGPSTSYTTKLSYFIVRDDFTTMPKVREADTWGSSSSQVYPYLFADASSVMVFTEADDAMSTGQAWLLALDAEGAPDVTQDWGVGRMGGTTFVGDLTVARNRLRARVYAPQSDLWLPSAATIMSHRLTNVAEARRSGLFRSDQWLTSPATSPTDTIGLVYRYRTLGQQGQTLTATLEDVVQVLMSDLDGVSASDPERASVYGVLPLADGFWLGVTTGGAKPEYYQLFEEV